MFNNPNIFPELNFEYLQSVSKSWVTKYPSIKCISLHRPTDFQKYAAQYILVWHVLNPHDDRIFGLDFNIKAYSTKELIQKVILYPFKNKGRNNQVFHDDWHIELKDLNKNLPSGILEEDAWILYFDSTSKESDKLRTKLIDQLIKRVIFEIDRFFSSLDKDLSCQQAAFKELEVNGSYYPNIKRRFLEDKQLFTFREDHELDDFRTKMIRKIIYDNSLGPVTQKFCKERIRLLKENTQDDRLISLRDFFENAILFWLIDNMPHFSWELFKNKRLKVELAEQLNKVEEIAQKGWSEGLPEDLLFKEVVNEMLPSFQSKYVPKPLCKAKTKRILNNFQTENKEM